MARLQKVGVPCAPINDMTHMKAHPQTAALDMVQPVPEIDLELMSLPLSFDGERPMHPHARAQAGRAQRGGAGPAPGTAPLGLMGVRSREKGSDPLPDHLRGRPSTRARGLTPFRHLRRVRMDMLTALC